MRQHAFRLEPQVGQGMAKEDVQVEQHGVVGMVLGEGNGQVDGDRRHARAAARRIDRGHVAARRAQLIGRCFGGQTRVGLRLTFGGD